MARKASNPMLIHVVQQLKPEFWAHAQTDPVFVTLLDQAHLANDLPPGDPMRNGALHDGAASISSYVVDRLESFGLEVEDAHAIVHGDDTIKSWDAAANQLTEVKKALHLHLVVKFRSAAASASLAKLATLIGVEAQYIEKGRAGGNPVEVCGKKISQSHDNMLAYLVHAK